MFEVREVGGRNRRFALESKASLERVIGLRKEAGWDVELVPVGDSSVYKMENRSAGSGWVAGDIADIEEFLEMPEGGGV